MSIVFLVVFLLRQGKVLLLITTAWALLGLLTGCVRPPARVSFERLCLLTPDRFAAMDEEHLRQWLRDNFAEINKERREKVVEGRKISAYKWGWNGSAFLLDGHLVALVMDIDETDNGLTLGEIVDSLGPPATLSTLTGLHSDGLHYAIQLDYSEQGLVFTVYGVTSWDVTEVELTRDTQVVPGVLCFVPGSKELITRLELYKPGSIPWPGFGATVRLDDP